MSGQPTEAQKQQYLQQVKQQAQVQMMQELSAKMTEKCFKVSNAGTLVYKKCVHRYRFIGVLKLSPTHIFNHASVVFSQLCAGKKGDRLDTSESQCVVHCMDRYMDAMQVVTQALEAQQHK